jgi:hypothetical protein
MASFRLVVGVRTVRPFRYLPYFTWRVWKLDDDLDRLVALVRRDDAADDPQLRTRRLLALLAVVLLAEDFL